MGTPQPSVPKWDEANTPWERCLSAHHLATVTTDPREALHWARLGVQWAAEAPYESVVAILPNVYLSLATGYRACGDDERAQTYYLRAGDACGGDADLVVRGAITTGLVATGFVPRGLSATLIDLLDELVRRRSAGALAMLLPAVLRGSVDDDAVAGLARVLDDMFWTPGIVDDDLVEPLRVAAADVLVQLADGTAPDVLVSDDTAIAAASTEVTTGAAQPTESPVVAVRATAAADPGQASPAAAAAAVADDVPFRI